MKPPTEPQQEDCCNSGCNPCIFDVYEKHLKEYKLFLNNGASNNTESTENGISEMEYTEFILKESLILNETHKVLMFKSNKKGCKVKWKPGDHFLVKYNKDTVSCTRAYTPFIIRTLSRNEDYDFMIVVKQYKDGLVSKYLYSLPEKTVTLWRGPYGCFKKQPTYSRIIMVAQGTGIAPFISIIQDILNNEDDFTKIVLLFCSSQNIVLFREQLFSFQSFWNFTYKVFIKGCHKFDLLFREPFVNNILDIEQIQLIKPCNENDQILICGSSDFMSDYNTIFKSLGIPDKNIVLF